MSALTSSPAWQALTAHAATMRGASLRALFAADPQKRQRLPPGCFACRPVLDADTAVAIRIARNRPPEP